MIKSELINKLANKLTQIPELDVAKGVNAVINYMRETLGNGGRIEVRGFGSFSLHYRAPRNAHNPKTGERVLTTAKHTPHFKPGKELRERVDASKTHHPIIQRESGQEDE